LLLNFHEPLETKNTVLPLIQLESRAGYNSASTVKVLEIEDEKIYRQIHGQKSKTELIHGVLGCE